METSTSSPSGRLSIAAGDLCIVAKGLKDRVVAGLLKLLRKEEIAVFIGKTKDEQLFSGCWKKGSRVLKVEGRKAPRFVWSFDVVGMDVS